MVNLSVCMWVSTAAHLQVTTRSLDTSWSKVKLEQGILGLAGLCHLPRCWGFTRHAAEATGGAGRTPETDWRSRCGQSHEYDGWDSSERDSSSGCERRVWASVDMQCGDKYPCKRVHAEADVRARGRSLRWSQPSVASPWSGSEGLMANMRKATAATATPSSSWSRATSSGKQQPLHLLLCPGSGLPSLLFLASFFSVEPFCPISPPVFSLLSPPLSLSTWTIAVFRVDEPACLPAVCLLPRPLPAEASSHHKPAARLLFGNREGSELIWKTFGLDS